MSRIACRLYHLLYLHQCHALGQVVHAGSNDSDDDNIVLDEMNTRRKRART